jgi:septal ring factor EnvC (AmiA/AmiB activator)
MIVLLMLSAFFIRLRLATCNVQRVTYRALLTGCLILFFALPALAATPALERKSQEELKQTLEKIHASKARSGQLKAQTGKLEKQLSAIGRDAARIAADIQTQESALTAQENRLEELEQQKQQKEKSLRQRRQQLSQALSAMIRLSSTPKEAVIAKPGSLEETLKTADALGVMSESLRQEADRLNRELADIAALQTQIEQQRAQAEEKRKALAQQQQKLKDKIAASQHLKEKLYRDQKREDEAIAQLSRKSASLQDLLNALEDARKLRDRINREPVNPRHPKAPQPRSARPETGFRLPAAGRILRRYGQRNARGLTIETRSDAQIVAPGGGEVVFTGPFMDYGRMVIIRHADGLHSLLAGFDHIDVSPGDAVTPGEPLGRMGTKSAGNRLYLELRKDGRPVDPTPWFK